MPIYAPPGYGEDSYGLSTYGGAGEEVLFITRAECVNGLQARVFFGVEASANAALTNPSNYVITAIYGAPVTVTSVTVDPGAMSVVLGHSGTTLGGVFLVTVFNVSGIAGQPLSGNPTVAFRGLGDLTTVEAVAGPPGYVFLSYLNSDSNAQAVIAPGAINPSSYTVTAETGPSGVVTGAAFTTPSTITLEVSGLTSRAYLLTVNPSEAFDYVGSVLPSADPQLNGTLTGTGVSSAAPGTGLVMSKNSGVSYGWYFGDTSGRVVPGCSCQVDFAIDVSSTVITPSLFDTSFVTLSVSDGDRQVDVVLGITAETGLGCLLVKSGGTLLASSPADWNTAPAVISALWNARGDFTAVLVNGIPVATVPNSVVIGAPTLPSAGAGVVLTSTYEVTNFVVSAVTFQASSTVFTSAWNMLHGITSSFFGVSARNKVFTKHGPLVRTWGDATPATKEDVTVRVDGIAVDIASVNPYLGEITLVDSLPLRNPGDISVEIDYAWMSNPTFQMAGLNTRGLNLNRWERVRSPSGGRFPLSVTLGPGTWKPSPVRIGHTYTGWQRAYTALSNDPTTLVLNRSPHATSIGNMSADALRQSGFFDAQRLPTTEGWVLTGNDNGGLIGDGTYTLSVPTGDAGFYAVETDLKLPTVVTLAGRFRVPTVSSAFGVFSGVALGVHDGRYLAVIGCLTVDGVKHVGVLQDGDRPDLESSWEIGPAATATAISPTQVTISAASFPAGVGAGTRFRVPSTSPQGGVYTISACGVSLDEDGNVVLDIDETLPVSITAYNAGAFEIFFEVPWDSSDLISVRAQVSFPSGDVTAYVGGAVSGLIATTTAPSMPVTAALLLPTTGSVFWGDLSRLTANDSVWDLVWYASNPVAMIKTSSGISVVEPMTVFTPEFDPTTPWFQVGGYGFDRLNSGLLISSTAASDALDLEFSISREEPHLTYRVTTDLTAGFNVESSSHGCPVSIRIEDGRRTAELVALTYVETVIGRSLVFDLPSVSISGLLNPTDEGWVASAGSTLTALPVGRALVVSKGAADEGTWDAGWVEPTTVGYDGVVFETRLQVSAGATIDSGTGLLPPVFFCRVPVAGGSRVVGVAFDATNILWLDEGGVTIFSAPFVLDDDSWHHIRTVCAEDADTVACMLDDAVLGVVALTAFSATTEPSFNLSFGLIGDGVCGIRWAAVDAVSGWPVGLTGTVIGRTFGFWLGNDRNDINDYRIPRSDGLRVSNSSLSALPVPMDWSSFLETRLYIDPTWGVGLYRPDIPAPPWATGNSTTETTFAQDAWMNVEYSLLPRASTPSTRGGRITFGATNPESVSQSRWDSVRYRIRARPEGYGIAPTGMVLNRRTTFGSNDRSLQRAPEVVSVPMRTALAAVISDSAIFASRVFVVQTMPDGTVIPSSGYVFNSADQTLTFSSPVSAEILSVTIAPGTPVTPSYRCSRLIDEIVTVLNTGTPPIPKSRDGAITRTIVPDGDGSEVVFTSDETSLYAKVEYCETSEGEDRVAISFMSDGPGSGEGFSELGISGAMTTDPFTVTGGPGGVFGKGSPTFGGSVTHFSGVGMILAGGRPAQPSNGVLNSARLASVARGVTNGPVPEDGMGMDRDFALSIRDQQTDTYSTPDDNVSPDDVPGVNGHGACIVETENFLGVSRIGPWGGLPALSLGSLLGGGVQASAVTFILSGGAQTIPPIVTRVQVEAAN